MPALGHVPGLVPERPSQPDASARSARTSCSRCATTATAHEPMAHRFSNQRGVSVRILDYGKTESAPFYEPMYEALEARRVRARTRTSASPGYDSRLTPDMDGFLQRTKRLIENTYRRNGHTPGAPRRPLERPALRAVPAHAHVARRGSTATSTASRRSPATSPARARSTRCSSPGSTSRTSRSRRPRRMRAAAPACT